jgi:hypothetical protein
MTRLPRWACPIRSPRFPYLAGAARSGNDDAARELVGALRHRRAGPDPQPRAATPLDERSSPRRATRRPWRSSPSSTSRASGSSGTPQRAAEEYVRAPETGGVDPEAMRGTVNGFVPPWDTETALAFQAILQERGLYLGALDAQVGPGTLGAARALAQQ